MIVVVLVVFRGDVAWWWWCVVVRVGVVYGTAQFLSVIDYRDKYSVCQFRVYIVYVFKFIYIYI